MRKVNMHEAKSRLSTLVRQAVEGEDIVIAKAGIPMVKLTPVAGKAEPRTPGRWKGRILMAPDFDETTDEFIRDFEEGRV